MAKNEKIIKKKQSFLKLSLKNAKKRQRKRTTKRQIKRYNKRNENMFPTKKN